MFVPVSMLLHDWHDIVRLHFEQLHSRVVVVVILEALVTFVVNLLRGWLTHESLTVVSLVEFLHNNHLLGLISASVSFFAVGSS